MFRKTGIYLFMFLALFLFAVRAEAALINFDDLSTPNNTGGALWGVVPSPYQGYTWTSSVPGSTWEVQENNSYKSVYANSYNFQSLPNAAYNGDSGAKTVYLSSASPFNFDSAYFWTWTRNNTLWSGVSATSLTVSGYSGATLVGSTSFNLAYVPTLVQVGLTGVDEVRFTSNASGTYWLMDNAVVTPIPPSVFLLGAGLMGIGVVRKRIRL